MITKKINTALYSIGKRLQGYHLLKNPKGTPYTTVKLIKYSENINPKTLDINKSYEKITKQVSGFENSETKEFLEVTNFVFYNNKTNKIDNKKQLIYEKYDGNKFYVPKTYLEKGYVPTHKLDKRDLSSLDNIVELKLSSARPSLLTYLGFAPKSVITEKTLAQTVLEKYNKTKLDDKLNSAQKQNFWKTLWQNLNPTQTKNS